MKKSILKLSALSLITAIVTLFWAGTTFKKENSTTMSKGSIYDFKLKTIDGEEISLSKFKGKKMLLINVASECGYTPQYKNLQALHQQYGSKLVLIGFPANNFGISEAAVSLVQTIAKEKPTSLFGPPDKTSHMFHHLFINPFVHSEFFIMKTPAFNLLGP